MVCLLLTTQVYIFFFFVSFPGVVLNASQKVDIVEHKLRSLKTVLTSALLITGDKEFFS